MKKYMHILTFASECMLKIKGLKLAQECPVVPIGQVNIPVILFSTESHVITT